MTSPESITPAQMHRIPAQQDDEAADQPITTPEDVGLATSRAVNLAIVALCLLALVCAVSPALAP